MMMTPSEIKAYLAGMASVTDEPCVKLLGESLPRYLADLPEEEWVAFLRPMLDGIQDTAACLREKLDKS
jgi:hypothetical protein